MAIDVSRAVSPHSVGAHGDDDFTTLFARLLVSAEARIGDADAAEDIAQETIIAAWEAALPAAPAALAPLLDERCRCWQARRRDECAALRRLAADGAPPPWVIGAATGPFDAEAIVEAVVLRLGITERLREGAARDADVPHGAAVGVRAAPGPARLTPVPPDLARTNPIAAARVRAGVPVAEPPMSAQDHRPPRSRRRRTDAPATGPAARLAARSARVERLTTQLRERERAAERAGRHLEEARRRYDRTDAPGTRAIAEAALATAAVRHERAQAARRGLERRLARLVVAPAPAPAPERRGGRR
jgi:hypothetical protein